MCPSFLKMVTITKEEKDLRNRQGQIKKFKISYRGKVWLLCVAFSCAFWACVIWGIVALN